MSFRQIVKEKEFWILCSLILLMFPAAILSGETLFYRDIYLHALPVKKLYSQILRSGQLPLWHPYLNGGQPLLAEINFSVFYPSNLLYLIFPLYTAFNLITIGHLILGAAGAYCLGRFIGLSVLSSLLCGIIFSCCGYSLSLLNFPKGTLAHAYIPWLTLIWHRFLLEKNFRWFFLSVLLGVFQIFAGVPEWTFIIFLLLLIWTIAYPYQVSMPRRIIGLVLLGIIIILCSAIQIIPSLEMVAVSARAQQNSYDSFAVWSLHFERIPEIILPRFLGSVDTLSSADYWGSRIEDQFFPYILSIYFGISVLLLSLSGVNSIDKSLKKLRYSLAAVSILALLFSLGRYFPLTYFLYQWIPGIDHFRYPEKFLCIAILPISLLAAFGFESQWCRNQKPAKKVVILLWSFVFGLGLLMWLVLVDQSFLNIFAEVFFKRPASVVMRSGIARSILHSLLILIFLTLIYTVRRVRESKWNKIALLALITLDLFMAGRGLNPFAPVSFYEETPDAVNLVRKELSGGKFYRTPNPPNIVLKAPSNDILWQYRWNQEVLQDYLATTYDISTIFHGTIDGLEQKRLVDLSSAINFIPWPKRLPLLSAAGVSVIMTHEKLSVPGIELGYVLRNRSNVPFYIYKNTEAIIPASRVSRVLYRKDFKDSLGTLTNPDFSPKTIAISDEQLPAIPNCNDTQAFVRLKHQTFREIEYETTGACDGFLVLTLPYYKDWKVKIDDRPERLLRMNWAFSGVKVPEGKHRVSLRYSASSVKVGTAISILSLLLLTVLTRFNAALFLR